MKELDAKLTDILNRYSASGIEQQIDYEKFYLYSLITHSTAIEGSSVTEVENHLLFDEGIAAKGRSMVEQMMNVDLKDAYLFGFEWAKSPKPYTVQFLCRLASMVMRRTGSEYSTMVGKFNSSLGELRLCNVSAGAGGKSYLAYNKVPKATADFCDWLNSELATIDKTDVAACYRLSFEAHYRLVTIHPWVDGNGRTTRLLMNIVQCQLGLIPSIVSSDNKAEYIESLIQTRETEDMSIVERVMLTHHIATLESRLSQYLKSLDDTINDTIKPKNDTIDDTITSRQQNIMRLIASHPGISRVLLSSELGVSVPTIARDIAVLLDKQLVERVGGNKAGYKLSKSSEQ